jgi:hypothetical protein
VNVAEALPFVSVVAMVVFVPLANVPLAPVVGAVKVTVAPLIGFESLSATIATNGFANAVLTMVLCGVLSLVAVIEAGVPAMLVRLKLAIVDTPVHDAVTVYGPPAVIFAVNVTEALPFVSVVAVVLFVPLANVPLAPVAGAVNVTVTPLTGVEPLSRTVATSGENAVPTLALCGVPLVAAIDSTGGIELEPPPQPTKALNVKKIKPIMLE